MTYPHRLSTISIAQEVAEDEIEALITSEPAKVFDADFLGQEVPEHFNAVKIILDGSMQGDLAWDAEKVAAQKYSQAGLKIFWEMELGLFSHLKRPLGDQAQFMSLCLSLEHFRDTLWQQFQNQTVGLCLYRGNANFSQNYRWDEEQLVNLQDWVKEAFLDPALLASETGVQVPHFNALDPEQLLATSEGHKLLTLFCRDASTEYLDLLARRLPDSLRRLVLLDCTSLKDPLELAQLTINECYPSISVAKKREHEKSWIFRCEHSFNDEFVISRQVSGGHLPHKQPVIGVCLPAITCRKPSDYQGLKNALVSLEKQQKPFRIIAESKLTNEWDGLDYLIVVPNSLSVQGYRKLRGFCAAGGTVVSLAEPLGLSQEMTFEELLKSVA